MRVPHAHPISLSALTFEPIGVALVRVRVRLTLDRKKIEMAIHSPAAFSVRGNGVNQTGGTARRAKDADLELLALGRNVRSVRFRFRKK